MKKLTAKEAKQLTCRAKESELDALLNRIKSACDVGQWFMHYTGDREQFLSSPDCLELKKLGYRILVNRGRWVPAGLFGQKKVFKEWPIASVNISWGNEDWGPNWKEL